jgi:hypothetical protein
MEGHVARMGKTNTYRFLVVKPEEKTQLEDLSLNRRIILKRILNMLCGGIIS